LLLRSKDFNSCKNCFDVRLFARFSFKPHKHIYVDNRRYIHWNGPVMTCENMHVLFSLMQ
jgi:hypothetical protein